MSSSFFRAPCTQPCISKTLFQVLAKSLRLSQSSCFKALYERSNEQSLSQSTLWLSYYQNKFGKNAVLRHLLRIIDKCLQLDFFKVVVFRVQERCTYHYVLYIPFYHQQVGKNPVFKQIFPSIKYDKIYQEVFQSRFFKAPYERSNKQLLFQNAMSNFINLL